MDRGTWWATVLGVMKNSDVTWWLNYNNCVNHFLKITFFLSPFFFISLISYSCYFPFSEEP